MRRYLFVLVGLLGAVSCIVALVHAQDVRRVPASSTTGASAGGQPSRLADRLKAIRESVVDEYGAAAKDATAVVQPPIDSETGAEPLAADPVPEVATPAEPLAVDDPAPGLPSILKRPNPTPPVTVRSQPPARISDEESNTADDRPEPAPLSVDQTQADALVPEAAAAQRSGDSGNSSRRMAALPRATVVEEPLRPTTPAMEDTTQPLSIYDQHEQSQGLEPLRPSAPPITGGVLTSGQLPILHLETMGPTSMTVGKPANYQIRISNQAAEVARDVYVRITLPSNVEIAGSQATSGTARLQDQGVDAGRLMWSLSELPGQRQEQLVVDLIARDDQPVDLAVDWTFKPASSSTHIEVLKPQLQLLVSGPKEITYGSAANYTIAISNPGTGEAENVELRLTSAGGRPETKQLGTIEPGGRREISLQLAARHSGTIDVQAVATADAGVRAEALERIIVRRPELKIDIAGPRIRYAGATANYAIDIENQGDADAEDVVVSIRLPEGAEYLAEADSDAGALNWPVGLLRAGEKRHLEVPCLLQTPGENRLEIEAMAAGGISANQFLSTHVEALADLKLVVNDPHGPTPIGENVVYEVHIVNRGTKAAHHVTVLAQFSQGIEPVGAEGSPAELVPGQVLFHPLDHLQAGETKVLKITARADEDGAHRFRVEVKCIDPETRLLSEETTRFFRHRKE